MHDPIRDSAPRPHRFGEGAQFRLAAMGLGLTVLCGLIDWISGPEIAFSIIYLIPISLVSWKAGRWLGLALAVVCGQTWLWVDLQTNTAYSHAFIPYWNGLVRLVIFSAVAVLMSEVANRRRAERELLLARDQSEKRSRALAASEAALGRQRNILQSVLNSMGEGVVVVDAQGQMVLSNPAAEKIWAALVGNAEWQNHPLAQVLRDRPPESLELCLPRLDVPDEIWLRVSGRPLLRSEPEISGGVIVFSDITARRKLERQIAEVSEREQRRLGQDLHDGLCQHLVSMAFAARNLAARLEQAARPEAAEINRLAETLNEAITQARDIARGLYLVQLGAGGLSSALEELAARIRSQHHVHCTVIDQMVTPEMEIFAATDLFRIAQEAVVNSIKHAKATKVTITIAADENRIFLEVKDNGIGISNPPSGTKGMGLQIMQYRARMIGATCTISPGISGGTVVTCALPNRPHDILNHVHQA